LNGLPRLPKSTRIARCGAEPPGNKRKIIRRIDAPNKGSFV
jgi:hypothetical protein